MFSKACEYGIKAVLYIAIQSQSGKRIGMKGIATGINSPEAFLFEDTTGAKISFLRQGSILTFQMELKKSEPKGNYRLTGDASTQNWNGNVLLPTVECGKWSMKLDSAFIPPVPKADSIKKERWRYNNDYL